MHCIPPCPNVWVSPGQWCSNLNCTRIPWRGCWSPDRWPQPEFLIQEEWGGAQNSFQTDSQVGPELQQGLCFENRPKGVCSLIDSCVIMWSPPTHPTPASGAHSSSCWPCWQLVAHNRVPPRNCPPSKEATLSRFHAPVHGQPTAGDWSTRGSQVLASIQDTLKGHPISELPWGPVRTQLPLLPNPLSYTPLGQLVPTQICRIRITKQLVCLWTQEWYRLCNLPHLLSDIPRAVHSQYQTRTFQGQWATSKEKPRNTSLLSVNTQ